jgi:erythrocyte membrane protein band 4.1
MLGAYCVQSDIGDYDPNDHKGIEYLKDIPFSPNQSPELLDKITELHKQHK